MVEESAPGPRIAITSSRKRPVEVLDVVVGRVGRPEARIWMTKLVPIRGSAASTVASRRRPAAQAWRASKVVPMSAATDVGSSCWQPPIPPPGTGRGWRPSPGSWSRPELEEHARDPEAGWRAAARARPQASIRSTARLTVVAACAAKAMPGAGDGRDHEVLFEWGETRSRRRCRAEMGRERSLQIESGIGCFAGRRRHVERHAGSDHPPGARSRRRRAVPSPRRRRCAEPAPPRRRRGLSPGPRPRAPAAGARSDETDGRMKPERRCRRCARPRWRPGGLATGGVSAAKPTLRHAPIPAGRDPESRDRHPPRPRPRGRPESSRHRPGVAAAAAVMPSIKAWARTANRCSASRRAVTGKAARRASVSEASRL